MEDLQCEKAMIYNSNYFIERELGKGMSGKVYLAKNLLTGKMAAVKEINKQTMTKREEHYLKNEIEILSKLSHNNIATVLQDLKHTENDSHIYIFLEFCNGGNLMNLKNMYKVNNTYIPDKIVQFIFRQIIEALRYLHINNIVHRDIKLENIMLHFPNNKMDNIEDIFNSIVKICDFGFARNMETSLARTVLGTPSYMAPEIILNKNNPVWKFYNEKVDIWSLGVILFEMLFFNYPFPRILGETNPYSTITNGIYGLDKRRKLTLESLDLLNSLLRFDSSKRLNLHDLSSHNFITSNCDNFEDVDLSLEFPDVIENEILIDSKEDFNLLDQLLSKKQRIQKSNTLSIEQMNEDDLNLILQNKKENHSNNKKIKIYYNYMS